MDRDVHYERTRVWALDEGYTDEESTQIARADWAVDRIHSVREWRNKGYHFAWLGAERRARRLFSSAVRSGDLVSLGEALHCVQDSVGHGFWGHLYHWDGIDRWDRRGPGVRARLERRSRELLAAYRRAWPVP